MLHGSINHVSITVSDLDAAMAFLAPILEFLGFAIGEPLRNPSTESRLRVNVNPTNGLAFNVDRREKVDALHELVRELGGEILDGPGEFPYAEDGLGYYAFYFLGPDGLKFECVHMPGLVRLHERASG